MASKITAFMLIATAMPFTNVFAASAGKAGVSVTGYVYIMLGIGLVYSIFLMMRMQRRKQQAQH